MLMHQLNLKAILKKIKHLLDELLFLVGKFHCEKA